jgi:hypothetical protein
MLDASLPDFIQTIFVRHRHAALLVCTSKLFNLNCKESKAGGGIFTQIRELIKNISC